MGQVKPGEPCNVYCDCELFDDEGHDFSGHDDNRDGGDEDDNGGDGDDNHDNDDDDNVVPENQMGQSGTAHNPPLGSRKVLTTISNLD